MSIPRDLGHLRVHCVRTWLPDWVSKWLAGSDGPRFSGFPHGDLVAIRDAESEVTATLPNGATVPLADAEDASQWQEIFDDVEDRLIRLPLVRGVCGSIIASPSGEVPIVLRHHVSTGFTREVDSRAVLFRFTEAL